MAFDKKPSKYSDESTIGSAEELDTYGVWVKSGPQDLTEGMAEVANFDAGLDAEFESDFEAGAIPFEDDFDENFGSLGVVGLGLTDEDEDGFSLDDPIAARFDQDTEDPPTPLLMKIADEITSIRSELNTLKREFADIRAEGVPDLESESSPGGFFNEGDDEALALTGDEMNNFLTSADFSDEESLSEDPQRSADEAALKELSEQNESVAEGMEELSAEEEIAPLELEEETPPEGTLPGEDFESPSFEGLSFEESPEAMAEETPDVTEDLVALEPLEPIEESSELRDLRLEGAVPQTEAPDNLDYLESDPLAEAITEEAEEAEETVVEETVPEVADDALSLDAGADDLVFEDSSFELTLDDLSAGEEAGEEPVIEEVAEEIAEPAEVAEPALDETELSLDTEAAEVAELALDETELSLDTETEEVAELALDETELSLDTEAEEVAEPALDEMELSLDTEAAEITEPALDETELSLDTEAAEPALEDPDLSFDSDSLELSEAVLDDADFSFDTDSAETVSEPAVDEPAVDEPDLSATEITEDAITEEQAFDAESLDLSDAVIDEPDLSMDLVEPPLEEPALDDISLDMDDFGAIDLEADDGATANDGQTGIIDDSLAQVIPEGFEVNAAEADVSPDDELEAFAEDELAAKGEPGVSGDIGIPVGLETELKKVLSYMDHLLESLPEDKIEEFAKSEYFDTYKKIFKELGLV